MTTFLITQFLFLIGQSAEYKSTYGKVIPNAFCNFQILTNNLQDRKEKGLKFKFRAKIG